FFCWDDPRSSIFIPKPNEGGNAVSQAVLKTRRSGVEFWQVNAKFTEKGVCLSNHYKMPL
ncbi:MAG: hypothetical protein LBI70_00385, partial [Rickettsiales bacterium]|nr:hypothetical protein [Rickettsiales bacterium]